MLEAENPSMDGHIVLRKRYFMIQLTCYVGNWVHVDSLFLSFIVLPNSRKVFSCEICLLRFNSRKDISSICSSYGFEFL